MAQTRGSRRHPLVIYRQVINRLWPETLTLGILLIALAWPIYKDPLGQVQSWRWIGMLVVGAGTILLALLLLIIRGMAYVQVLPTYLKLVTPFLRVNISYKRIRRTTTAEMQSLFPPSQVRGWKREMIASLARRTVIVIELNGWPASPRMMRVFLSPLFFKDETPNFVILVDDWMRFSTELESLRHGDVAAPPKLPRVQDQSILSRLPRKKD
jgi:hypothetical protein